MTNLLKDQEGVAAIQDDIIVYGRTVAEHDVVLQRVFETIAKSGLKLNEMKCEIRKPRYATLEASLAKKELAQTQRKLKQFRSSLHHRMYRNFVKYLE